MKKNSSFFVLLILTIACLCIFSRQSEAACRNPNLVFYDHSFITPAAMSGLIEITSFGHSFFQITSSMGTKIVTDPFNEYMGYPVPEVWPHVVTIGREHRNHNNVELAKGDPLILRGLSSWGLSWNEINTTFRDVLIYNVPNHMRAWHEFRKGSAFVFEMDGLCICHTGDLGEPFNEDQLTLIGHVDILLVPIGGRHAMGPENARKVVEQLKPKIAVPMHYYNNAYLIERFLNGPYVARFLAVNKFIVSRDTLPSNTEIFIPKIIWHGRDDEW